MSASWNAGLTRVGRWRRCVLHGRALLYIVVQTVGALVGAGVLKGLSAGITRVEFALGTPAPSPDLDITHGEVFGIELVITFVLVFTVFATCDTLRGAGFGGSGPLAIGLSLTMCHLWAVRRRRRPALQGCRAISCSDRCVQA